MMPCIKVLSFNELHPTGPGAWIARGSCYHPVEGDVYLVFLAEHTNMRILLADATGVIGIQLRSLLLAERHITDEDLAP